MGFEDDDYQKIKELNISDTQAYKMAGNSIVVNCLTEIFKKLKENCGLQSLFKDVEQYIKEDKKIIVSKPKNNNFIATEILNENLIELKYFDGEIEYISRYDYNELFLIKASAENTFKQKYEQLTLFDLWEEF